MIEKPATINVNSMRMDIEDPHVDNVPFYRSSLARNPDDNESRFYLANLIRHNKVQAEISDFPDLIRLNPLRLVSLVIPF